MNLIILAFALTLIVWKTPEAMRDGGSAAVLVVLSVLLAVAAVLVMLLRLYLRRGR